MPKVKIALVTFLLWLCQSMNLFGSSRFTVEGLHLFNLFFRTDCYDDLGCFYTGPPFFDLPVRPFTLPPWSPEKMDTKFLLFTPTQKKNGYLLVPTKESLQGSPFNENLETKVLIFGYASYLNGTDQFTVMKDTFLEEGDYNVIIVDWSNSNKGDYFQAVSNTRMAGAQTGQIVRFLQRERNISPDSVHIIGHSLGAQVAGYAGQSIPNLGRITGLDAGNPGFVGTAREVRLDNTDAQFVDGIHTETLKSPLGGIGYGLPYADLDFYPDGGDDQLVCQRVYGGRGTLSSLYSYIVCNHEASIDYFTESIKKNNCEFIGTQCESYQRYLNGKCDSNLKAVMGFKSKPIPGLSPGFKFYLQTSAAPPFCVPASKET